MSIFLYFSRVGKHDTPQARPKDLIVFAAMGEMMVLLCGYED